MTELRHHCEFCGQQAIRLMAPIGRPNYGARLACESHLHWVRRLLRLDLGANVEIEEIDHQTTTRGARPMTMPTFTTHTFPPEPSTVPLREHDVWDDALIRECGENLDDDEIVISELAAEWRGHAAGSLVVHGLTVSGYPLHVVTR